MSTARRSFLGRLAALLAVGATPRSLAAAIPVAPEAGAPDERWLNAIAQREQRILIETGIIQDALAFRRALNFMDVYNQDFATPDERLGVAVGVHSPALAMILNDAMWSKYAFGTRFSVNNAQGQPATASPFAAGGPATVEGLRRRGVEVLACNRSLTRLGRDLAGPGGNAQGTHAELVANVVPGVIVVPAMIVAVSRSTVRGVPYVAVA